MAAERTTRDVTVIVVDDDQTFRERVAQAIRARGYSVLSAADRTAARAAATAGFDFAIVDARLAGESGLDVVSDLLLLNPEARVVLATGTISTDLRADAVHRGALDCLAKPFDIDDVLALLGRG